MFEMLPSPSLETLLIAGRAVLLVVALCVFAVAFIRWRRADERSNAVLHEHLERAFTEIRSLHETIATMSTRLESLCERTEADSRLAPAGTAVHRGYDMAARLARNGANSDELVANCGVTRHEAELLVHLHGAKSPDEAPPPSRHQSERPSSDLQRPNRSQPTDFRQALARSEARLAVNEVGHSHQQPAQPSLAATRKRGSLLSVVG